MLTERVLQCGDVAEVERLEYWQELVGERHAEGELFSEHRDDFWARYRFMDLGVVTAWPAQCKPLVFRRTARHVRRSDPELLHVSVPLCGSLRISGGEEQYTVGSRELVVADSSRPSVVHVGSGSGLYACGAVEIPKALVPLPRRQIQEAGRLRPSARTGYGALLGQLLTQLAGPARQYQPADAPRLGMLMIDLFSGLLAQAFDAESALSPESHRRSLVLRIKAFILENLHEAELTPSAIAEAHHISVSYLHRLFENEEATVAAWIRRRRLERARRDLADPAQAATRIHAIAARWCFANASDFTRAFRTAFGTSPRDFRGSVLSGQDPADTD
ncbi:AraC family transcriptional regulator [Streptomyces albus]|nr:AraC family transcriptional regulator [Streptomyces albus]